MSWKERAIPAQTQVPSAGSWKDRATPAGQSTGGQLDDYWGDVGKNAVEGLKEIPQGATNLARAASVTNPLQIGQSIFQRATGTPWKETETGKDVQAMKDTITGLPGQVAQTAGDVGKAAVMPAQMLFQDKAPSQTMFGKTFRERPLSSIANVATVVAPVAKSMFGRGVGSATEAAGASAEAPAIPPSPNPLQTAGSGNLNKMAGLRSQTLSRATPMSANPADTGIEFQNLLQRDKVTGSNAVEIKPKFVNALNNWGKAVGNAWEEIKKANAGNSQGTPYYDKLQVNSVPTLRPILEEANDLVNSGYDPETGLKMKNMYQNLQNAANENDGFLTVDHVDKEMGRVGQMFGNAARDSDKFALASTLWGKLAKIREKMVNDVADASGRPDLAQKLKTANRNYSLYKRFEHDVHAEASRIATGQESMSGVLGALRKRVLEGPEVNRAIMKTGEMLGGEKITKVKKIQ